MKRTNVDILKIKGIGNVQSVKVVMPNCPTQEELNKLFLSETKNVVSGVDPSLISEDVMDTYIANHLEASIQQIESKKCDSLKTANLLNSKFLEEKTKEVKRNNITIDALKKEIDRDNKALEEWYLTHYEQEHKHPYIRKIGVGVFAALIFTALAVASDALLSFIVYDKIFYDGWKVTLTLTATCSLILDYGATILNKATWRRKHGIDAYSSLHVYGMLAVIIAVWLSLSILRTMYYPLLADPNQQEFIYQLIAKAITLNISPLATSITILCMGFGDSDPVGEDIGMLEKKVAKSALKIADLEGRNTFISELQFDAIAETEQAYADLIERLASLYRSSNTRVRLYIRELKTRAQLDILTDNGLSLYNNQES